VNSKFQDHIANRLNEPILSCYSVSGGDISRAYKIDTPNKSYFLKINNADNALSMFQSEAYGLQLIQNTNTIKVPTVLFCDGFQDTFFLIMEYIESKSPSNHDLKVLGTKLAELHQNTSDVFGLKEDNFIGSLSQSNKQSTSWVDFYAKERLLPQLQLTRQKGLLSANECPSENIMTERLEELFFNVKPSMLHGDLWSGNYLISTNGIPYLIDPAIYYGHHEVDIAMTKLFGGFGDSFYKAHSEYFPVTTETRARIEIYQLYYLLVHLNLFGKSYYNSVKSILIKYF